VCGMLNHAAEVGRCAAQLRSGTLKESVQSSPASQEGSRRTRPVSGREAGEPDHAEVLAAARPSATLRGTFLPQVPRHTGRLNERASAPSSAWLLRRLAA
jgi:hypothetical protein